jgi:hypothetical protein
MQDRRLLTIPTCQVPIIHPTLFYDNGDGTFSWVVAGDGSGYGAVYTNSAPFVGTNRVSLYTRSSGATAGDKASMTKKLWLPPTRLLRLQFCQCQATSSPDGWVYIRIYWYDGTNINGAELSYNTATRVIAYASAFASSYVDTTLRAQRYALTWNKWDLSINLNARTFNHLTVNNQVLDMSSIAIPTSASAEYSRVYLQFEVETATTAQFSTALDQILLTAENP